MAAAFIRAHFEDLGLTAPIGGNYYQPMEFYTTAPGETYLAGGKNRFMNLEQVIYSGGDTNGEVAMPLVFAGHGAETDLDLVGVKDKAVLLLASNDWTAGNRAIVLARQKGAKLVLVCDLNAKDFDGLVIRTRRTLDDQSLSATKPALNEFPTAGLFHVSPDIVQKLIGIGLDALEKAAQEEPKKKALRKIKPSTITYKASTDIKIVKTENILGLLEGTDKKDELLIISAHFDHVGLASGGEGDVIFNGADDDGSGTVAVMELAKIFAEAKKDGNGPNAAFSFMAFTVKKVVCLVQTFMQNIRHFHYKIQLPTLTLT
jgi:hypothetical protein